MNHQLIKGESVGTMLDLDAILDTRHGTIKKLYPELFQRLGILRNTIYVRVMIGNRSILA